MPETDFIPPEFSKRNRIQSRFARAGVCLALTPFMGWCVLALWFDGPANRAVAGILVAIFAAAVMALLWRVRPFGRCVASLAGVIVAVMVWWFLIPPSNDRDWQPEVAQLPSAEFEGNRVTIHNIRNFEYRSATDFTEQWETRTYDLDQIRGFDMFLSYWGPKLIAHTIASWEFADGRHLAISIETRKEKGEEYSALRGFFRQFELYYVVADERDVIGLRAAQRGENVFLYRIRNAPQNGRALLVGYLQEVNRLAKKPKWYNALTSNCTTTIRHHVQEIGSANRWHWKLLVNGRLDELGYERGSIDTSSPFEEIRRRSEVTEKAKAAMADPNFSTGST